MSSCKETRQLPMAELSFVIWYVLHTYTPNFGERFPTREQHECRLQRAICRLKPRASGYKYIGFRLVATTMKDEHIHELSECDMHSPIHQNPYTVIEGYSLAVVVPATKASACQPHLIHSSIPSEVQTRLLECQRCH